MGAASSHPARGKKAQAARLTPIPLGETVYRNLYASLLPVIEKNWNRLVEANAYAQQHQQPPANFFAIEEEPELVPARQDVIGVYINADKPDEGDFDLRYLGRKVNQDIPLIEEIGIFDGFQMPLERELQHPHIQGRGIQQILYRHLPELYLAEEIERKGITGHETLHGFREEKGYDRANQHTIAHLISATLAKGTPVTDRSGKPVHSIVYIGKGDDRERVYLFPIELNYDKRKTGIAMPSGMELKGIRVILAMRPNDSTAYLYSAYPYDKVLSDHRFREATPRELQAASGLPR